MNDLKKKILAENGNDLEKIEAELSENLKPYLDLVSDVARHILFAGGKRLRPLLLVLSAKLCGYEEDYAKTVSTALEYLHAATLLHDDIVDDAILRRGKTVAHSLYGNATTVLVGDFLLARALAICADSGKIKVIHIISDLTENMSTGEVHQLMRKGDVSLTEDEYLEVIRRKTARKKKRRRFQILAIIWVLHFKWLMIYLTTPWIRLIWAKRSEQTSEKEN
jgi:octaprenyl-diphosphate synthase